MASDNPAMFSATLQLSAFDLEVMQGNKGTQRSKLLLKKECKLTTAESACLQELDIDPAFLRYKPSQETSRGSHLRGK